MCASSRTTPAVEPERLEMAVAQLVRLVDAASVSGDEAAAVDEAERIARELGLPVERMSVAPGRDNLLVGAADPSVILCTHLDTVPPHIPARLDATHVHGRGSADAKGVGVAMLHGLATLHARGASDGIACLLVVGEETDHAGARAAAASRLRPAHVVLGEPCGLKPARAQKGLLKVTLSATGTAGHSAYPEIGVSAIHRLLDALHAIRSEPLPADADLGTTTVNVGKIDGGVAANVISRQASALVLMRCAAPVDAVLAEIVSRLPAGVEVDEQGRAEPVSFLDVGEPGGPTVPFNTDAHSLMPLGATMTLLGPGDMRCAHADGERLAITELGEGIATYARIAEKLAAGEPFSPG